MSKLSWKTFSNGSCPPDTVVGGKEQDGRTVYVARAEIGGELTPGKMVKEARRAFIPWGGKENNYITYEVLVNSGDDELEWVSGNMGSVPTGAVQGGTTSSGEPEYVGRAKRGEIYVPGKMIKSHGGVLYPYGGKEVGAVDYEVLCVKSVTPPRE